MIKPPTKALCEALNVPYRLLCGPGPSNMRKEVADSLALPMLGHLHPEFTKIMDNVKDGIKYLFQTDNLWTLAVSGTGHCALEAACLNLLEPRETVLVAANGIWGQRFADVAERMGARPVLLPRPPGQAFAAADLESALIKEKPVVVFVTHGESSTGVLQPLSELGSVCQRHNALLLVDSVAAAGGVPLFMDQWGIDCLYTGSQKVLGVPPGICPISFSDRARQKIQGRKTPVQSFYLDMNELSNYWGCDAGPRRYHHTGPINLVYALREALRLLATEGLDASVRRHAEAAERLRRGLVDDLGLRLLVEDATLRLPTITSVCVPEGVDWKAVVGLMMQRHQIEISGGLGPTAGKIWRIGLMGVNAEVEVVDRILAALKDVLADSAVRANI